MSALAPTLQAFFITRLGHQRQASPRTVASYRDAFRLLLGYARARTGKEPAQLDLTDLDATFVSGFLDHLEHERNNSARTRNARLAALRSFYRFASYRHPEHAELIAQVLAIPEKRSNATAMTFLDRREAEALLAAPDQTTWAGRRRPRPPRRGASDRVPAVRAHRARPRGRPSRDWRARHLPG